MDLTLQESEVGQIYLTHFSLRIEDEEIESLESELGFISLHRYQKININK